MEHRDEHLATMAATQHGAFARAQAERMGFSWRATHWRVRQGRWDQLAENVFALPGAPATWHRSLWAAHLEAGPSSAVCGRAAARLLGLPGYDHDAIEVVVRRGDRHRLTLGRLSETTSLPPDHVVTIDGLRCTSIARCIFDLAGDVPAHLRRRDEGRAVHTARVARALDTSLARLGNTIERQACVVTALAGRGRPGSTVMRALLEERVESYVPVESELEALFVEGCRAFGLGVPRRQVELGGERGRIGRVDFLFADAGVVVEVDGRTYHDTKLDADADRWRDNELAAIHLRVLRVRRSDLVHSPARVAALLRAALATRRSRPAA